MLQLGQRLGDFEIVRLLGKGGMGEVYEAQQSNPSRRVALKVLAPWLAQDHDALQRFWREAEVPARLDHPGIVRIISMGSTPDGVAYFTMQLVRGVSMSELLRRAKDGPEPSTTAHATPAASLALQETPSGLDARLPPLPPPSGEIPHDLYQEFLRDRFHFVANYGAQAARALAYAHSQGVLHRDIKSSNLMIDQHGQLYIVDFGLTRGFGPSAFGSQVGAVRGTPWYMSPEQARGQEIDQRSDIYSLGVTLYELATLGVGPFTANRDSNDAVLTQVRAGQCLPLRMLAPTIPRGLETVILKAMQFKPNKRYATAGELAAALQGLVQPTSGFSLPPTPRGRGRTRWLTVAGAVGLAVLLVLLLSWVASFWSGQRDSAGEALSAQEAAEELLVHPSHVRPRSPGIPWPLLGSCAEPVYHKLLHGESKYSTVADALGLQAPSSGNPTVLALAHDPQQRHYELSAELGVGKSEAAALGKTTLGLFLGWRRNSPAHLDRHRCLWLTLDLHPAEAEPYGAARLGTTLVVPGIGGRGAEYHWGNTLVRGLGVTPLTKSADWHLVRVRVADKQVRVKVDDQPPTEFDLQTLLPQDQTSKGAFQPCGYHGIWVAEGMGFFRNVTLEFLPEKTP